MEYLLPEILLIDTRFLCSLVRNDISGNDIQLWRNFFKPIALDRNLETLETMLLEMDVCTSQIRCRRCYWPLKWTNMDAMRGNEISFMCTQCVESKPILKCNIEEAVKILIEYLSKEHPQIIASALRLILISGNMLNSISPPEIPDNPFRLFKSICENSKNFMKFGGTRAVIMAEIYEDYEVCELPILYLADTVSIPTRYFFQVMKFKSETFNPRGTKSEEQNSNLPRYQEEYLVKELTEIANLYVKPESYLVLGSQLQHLISPEYYKCSKHNLSMIVPFSRLCPLDKHSKHRFDITANFEKIISPAKTICQIVQTVFTKSTGRLPHELTYERLQLYLNVISWLLTFRDTPFEAMLYHIISYN